MFHETFHRVAFTNLNDESSRKVTEYSEFNACSVRDVCSELYKEVKACKNKLAHRELSSIGCMNKTLHSIEYADYLLCFSPRSYSHLVDQIIEHNRFIDSLPSTSPPVEDGAYEINLFETLSDDMHLKIFSFLDEQDLLSMRLVSKRMKIQSEKRLKRMPKKLFISQCTGFLKINLILELYENIVSLKIRNTEIPLHCIIIMLKDKLRNLKHLSIRSIETNEMYFNMNSESFPNLTSLSLKRLNLTKKFMKFINSLKNLYEIKLVHIDHSSDKSYTLPKNIRIVRIENSLLDWSASLLQQHNWTRIEKMCAYDSEEDPLLWNFISEMINLNELVFRTSNIISDVFLNKCHSLRKLALHVKSMSLPNYLPILSSVKELDLNVCDQNSEDIAKIFACFPSLEKLTFNSYERNQPLSAICQVLRSLTHLKSIVFKKHSLHDFDDTSSLLDFLEASPACTEYAVFVNKIKKRELNYIINKFNHISREKSNYCLMHIVTNTKLNVEHSNLPANVKLSFENSVS
ncbi:hypothetical protein B4U79_17823 [Dinothrombium tinctorium]|uniref:F-box domain-containing protein n=1 Tax=Dinothrombium tinctorium TaxID=1965070 RepID=A0A3S3SP15_9ACAR|nr:hypothetical protein B4U79_17823 [Dinothrombium tinctorium]